MPGKLTEIDAPRTNDPKLRRSTIGRYELVYQIATGGMANVYAAKLTGLAGFERLVAIKVIHPHLAEEQRFVEMFLDEARLAAGIHNANVAETIEVGEDDGLLFIVSELVVGCDLNVLLSRAHERGVRIEATLYTDIAIKVCRGLHEAHELVSPGGAPLGLVHRDVTPRNILLSHRGEVKLIDFGVAWARGRLSSTRSGTIKGKISYLSPEQILGQQVDRRADIFSLGIVLYNMATGQHPFPGASEVDRMEGIVAGVYTRARRINPEVTPEIEHIIARAMSPSRENRFPNAAVMAENLERFLLRRRTLHQTSALADLVSSLCSAEIESHRRRISEHSSRKKVIVYTPPDTDENEDISRELTLIWHESGELGLVSDPAASAENRPPAKPKTSYSRKALTLLFSLGVVALSIAAGIAIGEYAIPLVSSSDSEAPQNLPVARVRQVAVKSTAAERKIVRVTLEFKGRLAGLALDGVAMPQDTTELGLPADGKTHLLTAIDEKGKEMTTRFKADGDQVIVLRFDIQCSVVGSSEQSEYRPVLPLECR